MAGTLTAMIASIFSGGAATNDTYFNYTSLLLTGNGTSGAQNNTFLDSSANNFAVTRNGNVTQGTFSPFSQTGDQAGWSTYVNGQGGYMRIGNANAINLGTNPFTLECWIYRAGPGANHSIAMKGASTSGWLFEVSSTNLLRFIYGTTAVASVNTIPTATWTHVAAVREGTGTDQFKLYINGQREVTSTVSANISTSNPFYLAANRSLGAPWNGFISNFRMTNGAALYTADFTPPTTPLTTSSQGASPSNVAILMAQSNRIKDNSINNFSTGSSTVSGPDDTRCVPFSPFNFVKSWDASINGGSGFFDGSADYLTVADNSALNMGASDFTIEAWIYSLAPFSTVATNAALFSKRASAADFGGVLVSFELANTPKLKATGDNASWNLVNATSTVGVADRGWNHVAIARSGGNWALWVNGSRGISITGVTGAVADNSAAFGLGGNADGSEALPVPVYVSNVRVVKGTAVYNPTSASITVPTAPLTAIANTSLLLSFTNAGIFDAASKNVVETVGDVQISNAQSKWGGSSISFNGSGARLLLPDQVVQRVNTGNFTVEMWVYINSPGNYGLIGKGTGTTGWLVSLNSSNQVVFTFGSSTIVSSSALPGSTWVHIAVVRSGTGTNQMKIYINGTNDGSGTVSTSFSQSDFVYVGADRTGGSPANVFLQDLRVTNLARYTSNFTAPTAPFLTL